MAVPPDDEPAITRRVGVCACVSVVVSAPRTKPPGVRAGVESLSFHGSPQWSGRRIGVTGRRDGHSRRRASRCSVTGSPVVQHRGGFCPCVVRHRARSKQRLSQKTSRGLPAVVGRVRLRGMREQAVEHARLRRATCRRLRAVHAKKQALSPVCACLRTSGCVTGGPRLARRPLAGDRRRLEHVLEAVHNAQSGDSTLVIVGERVVRAGHVRELCVAAALRQLDRVQHREQRRTGRYALSVCQ